jgi:iron-sulfur cluster assembly protein
MIMQEIATIPERPILKEEITITDRALQEIREIKIKNNIPEASGLRVGVKGGGCSGYTYVLGFDGESKPNDKIFDIQDIKVYVDPKSLFFLSGTQLDFSDGLNGRGFVFNNPNAQKTCGCGNSFGV